MAELFLKFINENDEEQEVLVEQEEFIVGRHSENDLSIANGKLSRQHIKIQRYADIFMISDLGSSNGTTLNGEELDEPVALKNEDILNLGGGLEIEIELDDPNAQDTSSGNNGGDSEKSASTSAGATNSNGSSSVNSSAKTSGGSGIGKALLIAPILGLILILSVVGAVFLIKGEPESEIVKNDNKKDDSVFIMTSTPDKKPTQAPETGNKSIIETPPTNGQANTELPTTTPIPTDSQTPTETTSEDPPKTSAEESDGRQKVRSNSYKFMRAIATSNQKPVLLKNQLAVLESKINRFKASRALANNIKNAQANASQIRTLAQSKKLKPQFLATAALAKLGNSNGNVLSKAQQMADVLDNLNIQIGDEQADDNLIVIAAYNQGVQNQYLKMRNTLQTLAANNPTRTSEIRTIWYLKKKGKISSNQFDLALSFLAIGTITQNPKAFNVNANALNLN